MRVLKIGLLVLGVVFGLTVAGWKIGKSRSFQLYGGLVTHVDTNEKLVALTLDDGPTPAGTDAMLPVLDSLGIKATFFVTGRELKENPEYGRKIVEAGHELGNHSYSHQRMVLRSPAFVEQEITETDALIRQAGWTGEILFRPPYGKRLFVLPRYLDQTGRQTFLWDIEPESYGEIATDPQKIVDHVVERVQPGSIILMHIMYESRQPSRDAIPLIVKRLQEMGYGFVTLEELLGS